METRKQICSRIERSDGNTSIRNSIQKGDDDVCCKTRRMGFGLEYVAWLRWWWWYGGNKQPKTENSLQVKETVNNTLANFIFNIVLNTSKTH